MEFNNQKQWKFLKISTRVHRYMISDGLKGKTNLKVKYTKTAITCKNVRKTRHYEPYKNNEDIIESVMK